MRRIPMILILLTLAAGGCKKYVPANLPLDLENPAAANGPEYQDELGRTVGGAGADGPEYRIMLSDGTLFVMKSPRIRGDSVIGYYRPTKDEPWARASIFLYDVHTVDQERIDWLATSSLLVFPLTLALVITN